MVDCGLLRSVVSDLNPSPSILAAFGPCGLVSLRACRFAGLRAAAPDYGVTAERLSSIAGLQTDELAGWRPIVFRYFCIRLYDFQRLTSTNNTYL